MIDFRDKAVFTYVVDFRFNNSYFQNTFNSPWQSRLVVCIFMQLSELGKFITIFQAGKYEPCKANIIEP
jgi:hypothetical protein